MTPKQYDVLIVGGGFCGVNIAKHLQKKLPAGKTLCLIDTKNFFEYTPSIPQAVTDPEQLRHIRVPYKKILKRCAFVCAPIVRITPKKVQTKDKTFTFTYLVICSGATYKLPFASTRIFAVKTGADAVEIHRLLPTAKNIVIVGGGLVGTEIAGELVNKTKAHITILDPRDRLLSRNPERASRYAEQFLRKQGCSLVYGQKVTEYKQKKVITQNSKYAADLVLWCAGISCDASFLDSSLALCMNDHSAIQVNEYLQIPQFPNLFCGGDLSALFEEKTAQNAEQHAKVISQNILARMQDKTLKNYVSKQRLMVISLGRFNGILVYKRLVLTGWIPALLKKMIECMIFFKLRFL